MADSGGVQAILDAASADAELDDFGDDWFHIPLTAWVTDLEHANLTDFGRTFLRNLVVRDLARRLRVIDTLARHPEIDDVVIPPIIYVTGLERSGTTLLHNVLAAHQRGRALLRWELMEPLPPPEAATHTTDPRIAAVQRSADKLRGSLLERMHWVDADDPEECVWGFIDCVSMLGQAASLCMPAWADVLAHHDLTPAYENYRRLVKLLLWKHPVPTDGFLVLKAPQVGARLPEFSAVLPEARFVIPDRDPFRCIVSMTAMGESVVAPFCVDNPLTDDGNRDRTIEARMADKLTALAAFTDEADPPPIHVPYPTLAEDPLAAVASVFADLDIGFDTADAGAVTAFLIAQRTGRRSTPPADLPTMGYDHDNVLAGPAIRAYCDQFAIEPERQRVTGS